MLVSPEERILLLNILPPAEGNAILLRSVRRLRGDLSFSDDEIRDWHITASSPQPGSSAFAWDKALAHSVEIEISPTAREYVAACLKMADSAGRLHEGLLGLFDSFFPEE
jgi:hypothetical protein